MGMTTRANSKNSFCVMLLFLIDSMVGGVVRDQMISESRRHALSFHEAAGGGCEIGLAWEQCG